LDVLRYKRQAPALAAFPGMRAVDVTKQRMEHIMRSNGIARGRTPLRHWLIAVAVLVIVLPGERLTVAMPGDPTPPKETASQEDSPAPRAKPQSTEGPATAVIEKDPPTPTEAAAESDKSAPSPAAEKDEQRLGVDQAIDAGIRFLKAEQRADGSWPDPVGYPGGITSLCTLALLKSGVKPDEHSAQTALAFLRPIRPSMTYSTALQTLVFCATDPQVHRKLIERNVEWFAAQQIQQGLMAGAWGYPQPRAEGDNSNTGFAVLALYEAEQVGVRAGTAVWRRALNYWTRNQNPDGSWGYKPGLPGTGSMTSQGLVCVAAAAKVLGEDKAEQPAAQAIEKAAMWLTSNFRVDGNPGLQGQQGWRLYYLLALSKAARITGKSKFGEHDWFAEGSNMLLDLQQLDGSWRGTGHAEDDSHLATSMAILFLLQGRADKE
jgi:hypothetical protein